MLDASPSSSVDGQPSGPSAVIPQHEQHEQYQPQQEHYYYPPNHPLTNTGSTSNNKRNNSGELISNNTQQSEHNGKSSTITSTPNEPSASTSASTAASASTATRTIKRDAHPPTLLRNQACRTCRSRKVRCDATKPGCGACRKTATVQGRNPDDVVCEYDTEESAGGTGGGKNGSTSSSSNSGVKRARKSTSKEPASTTKGARRDNAASSPSSSSTSSATNNRIPRQAGQTVKTQDKLQDLERHIADLEQRLKANSGSSAGNSSNTFTVGTVGETPQYAQQRWSLSTAGDSASMRGSTFVNAAVSPNMRGENSVYNANGISQTHQTRPYSGKNSPDGATAPFDTTYGTTGTVPSRQFTLPASVYGQNSATSTSSSNGGGGGASHTETSVSVGHFPTDDSLFSQSGPSMFHNPSLSGDAALRDPSGASYSQPNATSSNPAGPTVPPIGFQPPVEEIPIISASSNDPTAGAGQGGSSSKGTRYNYETPGSDQGNGSGADFFSLIWPNWPVSLPSPKLVHNLCQVFFSKKFLGENLINKERFFMNLALPPDHRDFPHVALLHSMCAVATKFVSLDVVGLNKETYWRSEASPTDFHAAAAKAHIDNAVIRGEKLFSVAQAIILICFYSYTSARFVEVWLYCGLATRICSPLGLNHIEAIVNDTPLGIPGVPDSEPVFRKTTQSACDVPQTEAEKHEMAHTFWMAFTADRLAAACTGWASSLAEEEVSTLLPKPMSTIEGLRSLQPITPQEMEQLSISSPTFFTANSLPLVDSANLHYKSVVLLGRVCAFLRSSPWPIGADIIRGARNYGANLKPVLDGIPNTAEFKRLDALIVAFRLSFPQEYKNVLRKDHTGAVETNLISAHVIPHASTILLHESFCQSEDDMSMQRCLTSARAIVSIIYLLWGSSYDISLLQPFITFCWAVAGRTLVRELAFKEEAQDELAIATLKQEINVILSAMTAFADRSPLGVVVAMSLRALLADPQSCHPKRNSNLNHGQCNISDVGGAKGFNCEASRLAKDYARAQQQQKQQARDHLHSQQQPSTSAGTSSSSSSSYHGYQQSSDVGGGATIQAMETPSNESGTSASIKDALTPAQSFSGLLWELEQPGIELGQSNNYKQAELDLRDLLGPSFDQLLNAYPTYRTDPDS